MEAILVLAGTWVGLAGLAMIVVRGATKKPSPHFHHGPCAVMPSAAYGRQMARGRAA
jgi:hypothetical protein